MRNIYCLKQDRSSEEKSYLSRHIEHMKGTSPRVTILMPAYNAEKYIGMAISSILGQSYVNFELLIINDGSTDSTAKVIAGFSDHRIRFHQNPANQGIVHTLNYGLTIARGDYIVRMDSDDISRKDRLARQIAFMDNNPQLGVSGTWIRLFGNQPRLLIKSPVGQENVHAYMLFDNPLFHPTVIMRAAFIKKYNLRYDTDFFRSEDFRLWQQGSCYFPMDNLPEPLVNFRVHSHSVTATAQSEMRKQTETILRQQLEKLGITPSRKEVELHHEISRGYRQDRNESVIQGEEWLLRLQRANKVSGYVTDETFLNIIGMIWFRFCLNSSPLGWWILLRYRRSPLADGYKPTWLELLRFITSIVFHMFCTARK